MEGCSFQMIDEFRRHAHAQVCQGFRNVRDDPNGHVINTHVTRYLKNAALKSGWHILAGHILAAALL
jgi:hypothetical protein